MKKFLNLFNEYIKLIDEKKEITIELKKQQSNYIKEMLSERLSDVNSKLSKYDNLELYTKEEYNCNIQYIEKNNYSSDGYNWDNKNEW